MRNKHSEKSKMIDEKTKKALRHVARYYDLRKAEERAHILEGLLVALDHLTRS
jgi:DNA gyrase/topoisomerase IV subunit A